MIRADLEACIEDVRLGEGLIRARCRYPDGLKVIEGHFPTHAVMPGVYGLELALHLLSRLLDPPPPPHRVVKAKFARPILPEAPFTVEITVGAGPQSALTMKATLREADVPYAVLSRFTLSLGERR